MYLLQRLLSFLFLFCPWVMFAQSVEREHAYDDFEDVGPFFVHQKNFIPGEPLNQTVKTIQLAINIWQKDDGSGNFTSNDFVLSQMDQMMVWLNNIFANAARPVKPVGGIEYIRDSHIRFDLKEVRFIRNSSLHTAGCGFGDRLNRYVFDEYPHQRQFLNIHFTRGNCRGASGYANFPSSRDLEADSFIVTFVKDGFDTEAYNFWSLMLHLGHELGHNLDLRHPYDSEFCTFSHPDFLFDLFGFERQEWCHNPRAGCDVCFHDGGWACDLDDPEKTCTNNLMGGNKNPGSITPLQMGRMNRSLAMRSTRKYAWGYSDEPFVVNQNQIWSFNKKFFQDIVIERGVTLVVTGTLEMVPQASVIVLPGGKLIVDNGLITNALYSGDFWNGVVIKKDSNPWFLRWLRPSEKGEVVITESGRLENHLN